MKGRKNGTEQTPEQFARSLVRSMSTAEKLAQLGSLMYDAKNPDEWKMAAENGIGTVIGLAGLAGPEEIAARVREIQDYLIENTPHGIPAFFHCEALNGPLFLNAASFPSAISQASSWEPDLVLEMADIIRQQLLAVGLRYTLSPVLDVSRDPRWGRLTETYGEDETLASMMACAYVGGLQGEGGENAAVATGKHFVAHGLPEGGVNMAQNNVTDRELREVHCKPFQAAITKCGLMSVMNSYCSINREAIIGSPAILRDLLRGELGFEGTVVADYDSVQRLIDPYRIAESYAEAGELALRAGLDIECPGRLCYNDELIKRIDGSEELRALLDEAVTRILTLKARLGMFDHPYGREDLLDQVFTREKWAELSRAIALRSATLLKNRNRLLPLKADGVRRIAVIGPHADSVRSLFGHYTFGGTLDRLDDVKNNVACLESVTSPIPKRLMDTRQRFPGDIRETTPYSERQIEAAFPETCSLYEAIKKRVPDIEVTKAFGINCSGSNVMDVEHALDVAADADLVILTLGGRDGWGLTATNGEGIDNANIGLPGKQRDFAERVYALHRPTVVLHFDGKPLNDDYVVSHFDAILEMWQPGPYGAEACAMLLFGDASPSGKLPVTVCRDASFLPQYYSAPRGTGYQAFGTPRLNPNGYVNADAHPLFCFGYGLSYSSFAFSELRMEKRELVGDESLAAEVLVTNTGLYDAEDVVQFYVRDVKASVVRAEKQLVAAQRVALKRGETKCVRLSLELSCLAFLDKEMRWKVEAGDFVLEAGHSCEEILAEEKFTVLTDRFVDGRNREFWGETSVMVH